MNLRRSGLMVAIATLLFPGMAAAAEELVLIPELNMLVLLIALFVVMIFPINQLIFKPIFQALDERASRIEGARQRAEHIGNEADSVLARYEGAIADARAEAEAGRKQTIDAARAENAEIAAGARADAEKIVEKAVAELDAALGEARSGLRASAEELGRLAAERILGRTL